MANDIVMIGNLDLYQLLNLILAAITNILSMYLVGVMGYWTYRLRINRSRSNIRDLITSIGIAKFGIWLWTALNIVDIIVNNSNPPLLTLPARLFFLAAVIRQVQISTRVKAAPRISSIDLSEELHTNGRMILIVEDDRGLATVWRKILENVGLNAEFVTNSGEALVFISQEKPLMMIVDLGLPDMNGVELLKESRKLGFVGPAVAISGAKSLIDKDQVSEAGFKEFVCKPIGAAELISLVYKWARY